MYCIQFIHFNATCYFIFDTINLCYKAYSTSNLSIGSILNNDVIKSFANYDNFNYSGNFNAEAKSTSSLAIFIISFSNGDFPVNNS